MAEHGNSDLEDGMMRMTDSAGVTSNRSENEFENLDDDVYDATSTGDTENDSNNHDQLPTLEEYKMSMAARGETLSPRLSTTALGILFDHGEIDTNGNNKDKDNNDDDDDDDDAENRVHDQLPSPEEIKATTTAASNYDYNYKSESFCSNCLEILAVMTGILFIVVAIVIPTLALTTGEKAEMEEFKREDVVHYLAGLGISSQTLLDTPGTPQFKAAEWIAEEDELRMRIPDAQNYDSTQYNNNNNNRFVERYVLAVLYFATQGPSWKYQLNFLSSKDVCDWNEPIFTPGGIPLTVGVTKCDTIQVDDNGTEQQFVSGIFIYSNDMEGSLPKEIGNLRRLRTFNLPSNPGMTGEIPLEMQKLEYLEDIKLQYCSFTGKIPDWLGNLGSLTDLALSNNLFTGEIPSNLFKLSLLELFTLDDNILEGNIAGFGQLSNLYALYAEDAGLYGKLTEEMIQNWPNMYDLDLSGNSLSGSLPSGLFDMKSLVVLDLHGNSFIGQLPAPSQLKNNTNLRFISLYENSLVGSIPSTIGNLQRLQHLDLGKNFLTSTLPSELGNLGKLRYLYTNMNSFEPQYFPSFLLQLPFLEELSMKSNKLIGSIPPFIGEMTSLKLLDLDGNSFEGSIPEEIGRLQDLNFLLLNRNQLTGSLPDSIALMYGLKVVLIDGNDITGSASVLCGHYINDDVSFFSSNCLEPNPQVECTCCNVCCGRDGLDGVGVPCNNKDWSSNMDPLWEYSFKRQYFEFNELIASEDDTGGNP